MIEFGLKLMSKSEHDVKKANNLVEDLQSNFLTTTLAWLSLKFWNNFNWIMNDKLETLNLNETIKNPNPKFNYRWIYSTKWKIGPWITFDDDMNETIESYYDEWEKSLHFVQYHEKFCIIDFEYNTFNIANGDGYDRRQLNRISYYN